MIDSYHLYLNETRVLLRRQSGFPWRRRVHALGEWRWDAERPSSLNLEGLQLKKRGRVDLHVYVGSGLCKFMTIILPPGLNGAEEQRAAGQAQLQHKLGLDPADWQCAVDVLAPPNKSVLCAVRHTLLERIQALSDALGFRLVSFKPFIAGIWNATHGRRSPAAEEESVLLMVENDAFTVLVDTNGVVESLSALSHSGEPDLIDREIRRVSYALGGGAEERIRLAVSPDLLELARAHPERLVHKGAAGTQILYADFRDLLLGTMAEAVA
jgi:hypothetical protein